MGARPRAGLHNHRPDSERPSCANLQMHWGWNSDTSSNSLATVNSGISIQPEWKRPRALYKHTKHLAEILEMPGLTRNNRPKMESLVLNPTSAKEELIAFSASPKIVTFNQSIWNFLISISEVIDLIRLS